MKDMISTRKTEVRFTTSDPREMMGKFLSGNLLRKWEENFIDEDTGEVVTIERSEMIASMGTLIDGDIIANIRFHLQANDITEVAVSNQRREGYIAKDYNMAPWFVMAWIGSKKKKFLLYANSISNALVIVEDYAELNFSGAFAFISAKRYDPIVILKDTLRSTPISKYDADIEVADTANDEVYVESKYYQIEIKGLVNIDGVHDHDREGTFVLHTTDVDRAIMIITNHLTTSLKRQFTHEIATIDVKIETAKVISCDYIIDPEFSEAYLPERDAFRD